MHKQPTSATVMYPDRYYSHPAYGGGLMSFGPDRIDIGRDLGLTIPPGVLARVDKTCE